MLHEAAEILDAYDYASWAEWLKKTLVVLGLWISLGSSIYYLRSVEWAVSMMWF